MWFSPKRAVPAIIKLARFEDGLSPSVVNAEVIEIYIADHPDMELVVLTFAVQCKGRRNGKVGFVYNPDIYFSGGTCAGTVGFCKKLAIFLATTFAGLQRKKTPQINDL